MKLLTITALLISLSASAARTFHKNDGSARSGNPGTFTENDANTIKGYNKDTAAGSGSIQSGETSGVPDSQPIKKDIQKEEETKTDSGVKNSNAQDDKVLDMSTNPHSERTLPSGEKVRLNEEEE